MTTAPDLLPWTRLWSPINVRQPLEQRAEDTEPEGDAGSALNELSRFHCLVLLGPPGSGKTMELSAALFEARANDHPAHLLALQNLSSRDDLVLELNSFLESIADSPGLDPIVFLDGLDEAPVQPGEIKAWLLSWLRSIRSRFGGQLKLRLRITCRSAEWPEGFEAELRSLWGTERIGIFQLLPLSDADIRLAVAEWNLDFAGRPGTHVKRCVIALPGIGFQDVAARQEAADVTR
jgi:hypothetical protein